MSRARPSFTVKFVPMEHKDAPQKTSKEHLSHITENICVGDELSVLTACLEQHQITHIVSLYGDAINEQTFVCKENVLAIEMADSVSQDLKEIEALSLPFIRSALESGGKVLVHCFAGKSRSVSIVALHFMSEGKSFDDTMLMISEKRPCIEVNMGFELYLRRREGSFLL